MGVFQRFEKFSKAYYLDEVTFNNLQGYIASCIGTVANGTLSKHIARFRTFLEYCVNMDYILKNPAKLLKTQKAKTPIRYHFSKTKVKMILENANPRFKPFFELMLETGLRSCDMWNLTKTNFPVGDFLYIKQENQTVF